MPLVNSENPVFNRAAFTDPLLNAIDAIPVAAVLVTPFVKLFTAGPLPLTPEMVPADFTEATFTGYAAAALTLPLLGPVSLGANQAGVHQDVNFLAGAVAAPGETILGYWIDDDAAAPTKVYMAEYFETPIPISAPGDFISLEVFFAIAQALGIVF